MKLLIRTPGYGLLVDMADGTPLAAMIGIQYCNLEGCGDAQRFIPQTDPVKVLLVPDDRVGEDCPEPMATLPKDLAPVKGRWLSQCHRFDELEKQLKTVKEKLVAIGTVVA